MSPTEPPDPTPPATPPDPAQPAADPPSAEPGRPRSFLLGFVVLGAVGAFAALLFLSNYNSTSGPRTPRGDDPFAAFGKRKVHKVKRGKSKASAEDRWIQVVADGAAQPAPPAGAKNVVLVITTSVRKDTVTPYGAPPTQTPFLQHLAEGGARFADAIAASSFSRTSAASLLTGQHAAAVDMVEPGPGPDTRVLGDGVDTLAERLHAAGWRTIGLTANPHLNTDSGLAQGFDQYRNCEPNGFHPSARYEGKTLVEDALRALDGRSPEEQARPFFLQVDIVDAHAPLMVVPDLEKEFDPQRPNVAYRVAVNRVDAEVRALVDGLVARGHDYRDDTYVIVLSDHGEGNQDPVHHGPMHGRLLYESTVAVPWIVVGPDVPANRVVGGLASQTDLVPTVLGLVGLAAPAGIDGISHAALLKGNGERTARTRAFADTWYQTANRASIWTETMQCQKDFGTTEGNDAFADGCYDRRVDPEFRNLLKNDALTAELVAWRAEVTHSVTPAKEAAPAGKVPAKVPAVDGEQAG